MESEFVHWTCLKVRHSWCRGFGRCIPAEEVEVEVAVASAQVAACLDAHPETGGTGLSRGLEFMYRELCFAVVERNVMSRR